MQKLRNLRLAARLGIAFGTLALGLLVVSVVAFQSTDNLNAKVSALAVEVPQYTAMVDGIAARLPEEVHAAVAHLYVHDGDVKAQDEVAAGFEQLAAADSAAFAGMVEVLSVAEDAETRKAADGIKQLQAGYVGYLDLIREAMKVSRRETVDGVEDRVESRAIYTEQIVPAHEALAVSVAESSKSTIGYAAGEGEKAADAISATKRSSRSTTTASTTSRSASRPARTAT